VFGRGGARCVVYCLVPLYGVVTDIEHACAYHSNQHPPSTSHSTTTPRSPCWHYFYYSYKPSRPESFNMAMLYTPGCAPSSLRLGLSCVHKCRCWCAIGLLGKSLFFFLGIIDVFLGHTRDSKNSVMSSGSPWIPATYAVQNTLQGVSSCKGGRLFSSVLQVYSWRQTG
jgi:hypothetical protein